MSEWKKLELVECTINGNISYGIVQPGQDDPNGIPILRVNNFENGNLNTDSILKVSSKIEAKHSKTRLKGGEVLLTLVGSTGQTAIVPERQKGWNVARAVAVIDVKPEIGAKWINLWLRSSEAHHYLDSRANTTVQKTLNLKDVKSIPVSIPPENERKSIEKIIYSLEEKIELNRQMNQTLEAMAQALFKSWFVDFDPVIDNALAAGNEIPEELQARAEKRRSVIASDEGAWQSQPPLKPLLHTNPTLAAQFPASFVFNEVLGKWIPEGWEVKKLQELVDVKYGKDHKNLGDGQIPCYGSGGIMRYVEKPLFTDESVLIPRKGSLDNVMYVNTPFWSVDTMFYTKMKEKHFVKYFFYTVNKLKFSEMNEGSAVPSMTTAQLNSMDILLPSINCLSLFDNTVSKYFNKKVGNEAEVETLTQLRDRLLPELISGRTRTM
jgi:type I restriction enzyme S subunit